MHIVVDCRETRSPVYQQLLKSAVTVAVQRLDVGDYRIANKLNIERKTFFDFERSIVDTRLFRQARALSRNKRAALIVLEGKPSGRLRREQLQGALICLSVVFNLPVLRSTGPQETIWLFGVLSEQLCRTEAKGFVSRHFNPKDRHAQQIHMLCAMPRIGPKRAVQLLEHFGSVNAVVNATELELSELNGIGMLTARKIRHFLNTSLDEVDI